MGDPITMNHGPASKDLALSRIRPDTPIALKDQGQTGSRQREASGYPFLLSGGLILHANLTASAILSYG